MSKIKDALWQKEIERDFKLFQATQHYKESVPVYGYIGQIESLEGPKIGII